MRCKLIRQYPGAFLWPGLIQALCGLGLVGVGLLLPHFDFIVAAALVFAGYMTMIIALVMTLARLIWLRPDRTGGTATW